MKRQPLGTIRTPLFLAAREGAKYSWRAMALATCGTLGFAERCLDPLAEVVQMSRPVARNWTSRGRRTLALCATPWAWLFAARTIAAALGEEG